MLLLLLLLHSYCHSCSSCCSSSCSGSCCCYCSAAMIHWTRQIKEVLSAQDAVQTSENAGPLEEIDFWKNRCADLSGITTQLDKPGVKRITSLLQLAKSSYVAPFLKLSSQIKVLMHSFCRFYHCAVLLSVCLLIRRFRRISVWVFHCIM